MNFKTNIFICQIALNSRININKIGSVEKMLNRYVIYFFVLMLMEIIAFSVATMTQDIVFCEDGDAEKHEARKSLWGNKTLFHINLQLQSVVNIIWTNSSLF